MQEITGIHNQGAEHGILHNMENDIFLPMLFEQVQNMSITLFKYLHEFRGKFKCLFFKFNESVVQDDCFDLEQNKFAIIVGFSILFGKVVVLLSVFHKIVVAFG